MKKSKLILFLVLAAMAMTTSSCVTSKKVSYLQDMPKEGIPLNENLEATVSPYDELRIQVFNNGDDNELVRPFNIGSGAGYLVDVNGNIEFPILGTIHVEGLTRLQLQDTIRTRLETNGYINNPLVMARFMNFRVFFLTGDGGRVITINNERCTFLEALALSGALDLYTRRDRIGVMREVDGRRVIHYLDPRSITVFDDEFFMLQQNDIIFMEVSPRRYFTEGLASWNLLVSAVTALVSVLGIWKLLDSYIRPTN